MKKKRLQALILTLFILLCSFAAAAETDVVVVSLGDSYASGEGIEPFYGQKKALSEKVLDQSWLAHRSEKSWAGLLRVPGLSGTLSQNRGVYVKNADGSFTLEQPGNWFFMAASGARCRDLYGEQRIYVSRKEGKVTIDGAYPLYPQLDIFTALANDGRHADYVTVSIGGNDMGFASVIIAAVMNGPLLSGAGEELLGEYAALDLYDFIDSLWNSFFLEGGQRQTIMKAYRDIAEAAGPQATVLVAGYPPLIGLSGSSLLFNDADAEFINTSAARFNAELEAITEELRAEGISIYFVSVENEFAGREAYSGARDELINRVVLGAKSQDWQQGSFISAASMHPNAKGAEAYARCVQAKIDELEAAKAE